jgi:metallo-beta-lactamase family protein
MKLSFHGATEEVTGSCFLLETAAGNVLIDCGMKQGERMCMLRTLDPFAFDVKKLVAVLVTHAHFDHTGRLPELIAQGYAGPIYMTPPTKALTDIILEDSLGIMRENAERCGDHIPYTKEDKDAMLNQVEGVSYHTAFEPVPGISIMFHDAGHILGSAFVSVEVEGKRFVFSGDIGNDNVPILPDTEALHAADYVVCESTYGDRDHEPTSMRSEKLLAFAKKVLSRKGTLIIPAFSVERTQELLYELDMLVTQNKLPCVPVYLDSPLAIRATAIYRHFTHHLKIDHPMLQGDGFFSFTGLRETLSPEESKKINDDHGPKIIIAGNGMMTGGRILHHVQRYIDDERTGILVIGFQAPGTLGRKILNKTSPTVKIFGQDLTIRAEVEKIESFSAHGDRAKLARWLHPEKGSIKKIFLVHGEDATKMSFVSYLEKNTSAEIIIPRMHQVFEV